jgi:glycosyltransferase involved in cell wall biosynthesis
VTEVRSLLVVSHVVHFRHDGRLYAYGPYAREIDLWADLFPRLVIAAPCRDAVPTGDCLPLARGDVSVRAQRETGGRSIAAKTKQVLALPRLTWELGRCMRSVDAIHVRCPGNLGLLGVVLAPMFSSFLIAKYAGQWSGYPGEAWSSRLQRALLRSRWWRGPVTVYGIVPGQRPHVVPFFTSVMSTDDMARARNAAASRSIESTLRVLYVGRLSAAKNVDALIRAIAQLCASGVKLQCDIVGEGPERESLEELTRGLAVADHVSFAGGVEFERVLGFYERADVLVLISDTEGWPKAIAEAMAFGVICVGSNHGLVAEMLGEGRGFTVAPGDAAALVRTLRQVASSRRDLTGMRARASRWAQQYTLERLKGALGDLFAAHWGVSAGADPPCVTAAERR